MAFLNWTKVAIIYEEDYGKMCSPSKYSKRIGKTDGSLTISTVRLLFFRKIIKRTGIG
jgi:hypothetical protein